MGVFENDWIMRQIDSMSDMLGRLILRKEKAEINIEDELTDEEVKKYAKHIKELVQAGNYDEAMQYLQDHFGKGNMEYLRVALAYFDRLNALSEEELKKGNYTRNALYRDLEFISEQYGIHL